MIFLATTALTSTTYLSPRTILRIVVLITEARIFRVAAAGGLVEGCRMGVRLLLLKFSNHFDDW